MIPAPLAFGFAVLATGAALAELKLPRPRADPPMRFLRVMSSDPACEPDCPEWISAEGMITTGTAAVFARFLADLAGRRLPVLISSHGGSVGDALAMGEMIRAKGLVVAVARTLVADCSERARACPNARGEAITGGAFCASACPLVLAGGVERLVGPVPRVGVHQITTVTKEVEGVEGLTRVRKVYEQDWIDEKVKTYLTEMGIGEPVMSLLRKTPAASIRWLSLSEITEGRLATLALDPSWPVLADGANGLNGHALVGDAPDLFTAKAEAPMGGGGAMLEAAFAYRRGGGAVEVVLNPRAMASGWPPRWTIEPAAGGGVPPMAAPGATPARALMPRERFCALVHDGKFVATPETTAGGDVAAPAPIAFDIATMDGAGALTSQACP